MIRLVLKMSCGCCVPNQSTPDRLAGLVLVSSCFGLDEGYILGAMQIRHERERHRDGTEARQRSGANPVLILSDCRLDHSVPISRYSCVKAFVSWRSQIIVGMRHHLCRCTRCRASSRKNQRRRDICATKFCAGCGINGIEPREPQGCADVRPALQAAYEYRNVRIATRRNVNSVGARRHAWGGENQNIK